MSRRISIASTLVVLCGCQDYRFEQKCPETIKEQEIVRAAAEPRPADILFVVDNSCSMAEEQENLATNFNAFINEIAGGGNDYRIGVVTTDVSGGNEATGLRDDRFVLDPSIGARVWVAPGVSGCDSTDIPTSCFRGPNATTRIIDSTTMDADGQIGAFRNNVSVGSCGSGDEQGLTAMIRALERADGGCNENFLRDGANLVVIIVSDEDDGANTDVDDYLDQLVALKAVENTEAARAEAIRKIRVAVIVGADGGEASTCAIGIGSACGQSVCQGPRPMSSNRACTSANQDAVCEDWEYCRQQQCTNEGDRQFDVSCHWCSVVQADDCCIALPGDRYVRFAKRFEAALNQEDSSFEIFGCQAPQGRRAACLIDSICQENFGDTLARIARDLVITTEFAISPPAEYPEGIRVRLTGGRFGDGVELEPGADFDASATLVTLKGDNVPGPGENVEVFYVSEKIDSSSNPRGACGI
ncbi:MAG: VWA domain-containing protein [Deltaproteobacteria bacterium]